MHTVTDSEIIAAINLLLDNPAYSLNDVLEITKLTLDIDDKRVRDAYSKWSQL